MKLKVFCVLDSKTAVFGRPWFEQQEASAIRGFADAVNDSSNTNNLWNKHPEDFSLYVIGEYDDEKGDLIPHFPKSLVTASALIAVNKSQEIIQ